MDDFNFILFRERHMVEIHAAHNGAVPLDRDTRGRAALRFEQLRVLPAKPSSGAPFTWIIVFPPIGM